MGRRHPQTKAPFEQKKNLGRDKISVAGSNCVGK